MSSTTSLPTLAELLEQFRKEIEGYYDDITGMKGDDIPGHLAQCGAIHARVSQIRNIVASMINRKGDHDQLLQKFKTQELDFMLGECLEYQQKTWSRLVTTIEADYRMARGLK